jgi:hypothetical protein
MGMANILNKAMDDIEIVFYPRAKSYLVCQSSSRNHVDRIETNGTCYPFFVNGMAVAKSFLMGM